MPIEVGHFLFSAFDEQSFKFPVTEVNFCIGMDDPSILCGFVRNWSNLGKPPSILLSLFENTRGSVFCYLRGRLGIRNFNLDPLFPQFA